MKKIITVTALWLGLFLCSSPGIDLFHITADEQLAKFQDLFRSLVSEDKKSLSNIIACFVLGNDPDRTNQVALYDHDSFIDSLTAPSSNYDHISVTVDEESLTTKTEFRDGKSMYSDGDDQKETAQYEPYRKILAPGSKPISKCRWTMFTPMSIQTGSSRTCTLPTSIYRTEISLLSADLPVLCHEFAKAADDSVSVINTTDRMRGCYLRCEGNHADDIGGLLFEFRVGTGHIAAQSMGLDPSPSLGMRSRASGTSDVGHEFPARNFQTVPCIPGHLLLSLFYSA